VALIVQKYGGSSVATPQRIKKIAERVVKTKKENHKLVGGGFSSPFSCCY